MAAVDMRHLFIACGDGAATDMQPKSFAVSQDGGRSWIVYGTCHNFTLPCAPRDGPGWLGEINGLAASSPKVAWLAENRGTLIRTWNGGRTWQAAIPKQRISPGDQSVGPVQFVDSLHGWLRAGLDSVYRTTNGGKSWLASVVR
jgi:photosystem II stability/assembly factor-like uncharacterized protein